MKRSFSIPLAALAIGLWVAPVASQAAGMRQYGDPNDDSQVPGLNEAQLNRNYRGPWYYPNGTDHPMPAPPPGTVIVTPAPYGAPAPVITTVPPRY
jgi:hypothetical protein